MSNEEEDLRAKAYVNWINKGIEEGFISKPFCYTHDGDPFMTQEEGNAWDEGLDWCTPVVKLIFETGYNEETKYKEPEDE